MKVLREAGVPESALEQEADDLWVLVIGLTALVPGLATEDPEEKVAGVTPEEIEGILRRHLEAAVARHHSAPDGPALDSTG